METYLITGFSGFVCRHFLRCIDDLGIKAAVLGLDMTPPPFDLKEFKNLDVTFRTVDLLKRNELREAIGDFRPRYLLHLASYSSVAFSWKNPAVSFANNTNIFLNILEEVREFGSPCRVLSVGSSEEYGKVEDSVPLNEEHDLNPVSPYAVARVSQEWLSRVYVNGFGLDIVLTRSFNHLGPLQSDVFVVSGFAKKLVEISLGRREPEMTTGNLSIIRDFIDVRDVVQAYRALFQSGVTGEIYNVCSGNGITLQALLQKMSSMLGVKMTSRIDLQLVRPNDNPRIIGDPKKIISQTGWRPAYSIDQSLRDVLEYWKTTLQ